MLSLKVPTSLRSYGVTTDKVRWSLGKKGPACTSSIGIEGLSSSFGPISNILLML